MNTNRGLDADKRYKNSKYVRSQYITSNPGSKDYIYHIAYNRDYTRYIFKEIMHIFHTE